jgi:hypothetical protein
VLYSTWWVVIASKANQFSVYRILCDLCVLDIWWILTIKKKTPWSESASELYRPSWETKPNFGFWVQMLQAHKCRVSFQSFTQLVGTRYKPLHHLARALVHTDHVSFLWYCIQEGIFPKLHLVPQRWAFLPYQACHNNSSRIKVVLKLCLVSFWESTYATCYRNAYMFSSLCKFGALSMGFKYYRESWNEMKCLLITQ